MRSFPWDSLIIGKNEEYDYPIIDRPSSAEDLRELYKTFFTNGVFLNEEDAFQVTPGDGMNVIVAGGKCGIEGTIGYEAAPRGLAIQASSSTADRIDTVVLRWNNNIEVRSIDMYVKAGVAQDVPVRPTLTRSESVWELGIADIFVAKNTGAISSARITDTRLQTDRCGAVTPFATIDTTTFFNQIQAAIDENVATLQEQTQVAVELAKDAIDGTTAGNLQNQITANKEAIEANSALDEERWHSLSKTLWEGTWDSGSITVEGLSRYTVVALFDNLGNGYIGTLGEQYLQATSSWMEVTSSTSAQHIAIVAANRSGDTLQLVGIDYFKHYSNGTHSESKQTYAVKKIVGIV